MSAADESGTLLDHLTENINPNNWPEIGNPIRRPDPGPDELNTLIHTVQKGRRSPGRREVDETEPPGAA